LPALEPRFAVIVIDASVVINLLATGLLAEILTAVADRRVMTDQAFEEVSSDPRDTPRKKRPGLLEPWVASGALSRETLAGSALENYVDLVGADPPDDLGDGEAATIAWAATFGAIAALDDTKAIGVCRRRFGRVPILSTLDLLRHVGARRALEEDVLNTAIFDPLRLARMRVPSEHDAWVRQAVGPERLPLCTSLRRRK
jgi:hypothetical protein